MQSVSIVGPGMNEMEIAVSRPASSLFSLDVANLKRAEEAERKLAERERQLRQAEAAFEVIAEAASTNRAAKRIATDMLRMNSACADIEHVGERRLGQIPRTNDGHAIGIGAKVWAHGSVSALTVWRIYSDGGVIRIGLRSDQQLEGVTSPESCFSTQQAMVLKKAP